MRKLLLVITMVNAISSHASEIEPTSTIIPFHIVDGYALISGSVNGELGRFMFDTGTPFDFLFNNNHINLDRDIFVGAGHAGSGQPISIFRQKKSVFVNLFYGAIENEVTEVKHADFDFIQKGVATDYIGMVGEDFIKDKIFSIDYNSSEIKLYNTLPEIDEKYIKITVNRTPLPQMIAHIGSTNIIGYFDTGNLGTLTLTKNTEMLLTESKYLTIKHAKAYNGEPGTFSIAKIAEIKYDNHNLGPVEQLLFNSSTSDRIGFGYSFLKKHKTIWDLKNNTIYLALNI